MMALLVAALITVPVTLDWDARPVEEFVTAYTVYAGQRALWTGAETTATVRLPPGVHVLEVTASNVLGESGRSNPVVSAIAGRSLARGERSLSW